MIGRRATDTFGASIIAEIVSEFLFATYIMFVFGSMAMLEEGSTRKPNNSIDVVFLKKTNTKSFD
ncbi:MAG: hypothetical protein WAM14_00815 [Candidatus Nitrosopolaris sp.]